MISVIKSKGISMKMVLKGDYFNGAFSHPQGLKASEVAAAQEHLSKNSPADLSLELWQAGIFYDHIEAVIASAHQGYQQWRQTSFDERITLLKKYQEAVLKRKDEFAQALALEVGKPLWEAKTEAGSIASKVSVTITDSFERIKKKTIKEVMPSIDGHVLFKPLGPSLIIGPFNFPCHLANGQILAALLAGNSIIFKPSEKTIYSAQLMIECFHEAGFPAGVINFINGTGHTSTNLTQDKRIKGIYFTGSKNIGLRILDNTYRDLNKLVALELGGKNATILHHDANLEHALPELLRSAFLTSGQRCTSTSIILIHKKIEKEFIAKFKALTERIIVGHPLSSTDPFMGPLIDAHAEKLYFDFCQQAVTDGATPIVPAKKLDLKHPGYYVSPSVYYLENPQLDSKIIQDEIFGPTCFFIPYEDIAEAIKIANATEYGLAASIFTQDKAIYELALRDIESGLINLNRSTVGASARLPFGGLKNSGNHHPAAVAMIDHCVGTVASLETLDASSKVSDIIGLN